MLGPDRFKSRYIMTPWIFLALFVGVQITKVRDKNKLESKLKLLCYNHHHE
jgi:hypothetical protein